MNSLFYFISCLKIIEFRPFRPNPERKWKLGVFVWQESKRLAAEDGDAKCGQSGRRRPAMDAHVLFPDGNIRWCWRFVPPWSRVIILDVPIKSAFRFVNPIGTIIFEITVQIGKFAQWADILFLCSTILFHTMLNGSTNWCYGQHYKYYTVN